jgi:Domain of unknown function (DUF2017)
MPHIGKARGGGIKLRLEEHEADLMRELAEEMKALLEADIPRADPVIGRLFPDAYDAAPDAEAYRDLVEDDLKGAKRRARAVVEETLGRRGSVSTTLSSEEAEMWLTFLTDVRLAIGTRLEITEERMGADIDPDDPDAAALSVLHWLGWLQEMTLQKMGGP